jgi:hypothetical protein
MESYTDVVERKGYDSLRFTITMIGDGRCWDDYVGRLTTSNQEARAVARAADRLKDVKLHTVGMDTAEYEDEVMNWLYDDANEDEDPEEQNKQTISSMCSAAHQTWMELCFYARMSRRSATTRGKFVDFMSELDSICSLAEKCPQFYERYGWRLRKNPSTSESPYAVPSSLWPVFSWDQPAWEQHRVVSYVVERKSGPLGFIAVAKGQSVELPAIDDTEDGIDDELAEEISFNECEGLVDAGYDLFPLAVFMIPGGESASPVERICSFPGIGSRPSQQGTLVSAFHPWNSNLLDESGCYGLLPSGSVPAQVEPLTLVSEFPHRGIHTSKFINAMHEATEKFRELVNLDDIRRDLEACLADESNGEIRK